MSVSTAGSQVLRRQIEGGARADVFLAASFDHVEARSMSAFVDQTGLLGCNELVLVVPPSSPLRTFRDLPLAERIVLGTPEVPVGEYADEALARAEERWGSAWREDVRDRVVSREIDVRQVLARVALGEADAGLVYRTDARLASVRSIELPAGVSVQARYPIALLSERAPAASRYATWLQGAAGRALLTEHGFVRCAVDDRVAP